MVTRAQWKAAAGRELESPIDSREGVSYDPLAEGPLPEVVFAHPRPGWERVGDYAQDGVGADADHLDALWWQPERAPTTEALERAAAIGPELRIVTDSRADRPNVRNARFYLDAFAPHIAEMNPEERKGDERLWLDTSPFHEAGANAVDELALAVARAAELSRTVARWPEVEIAMGFAVDMRVYLQIAKLRAARDLWERLHAALGSNPPALRLEASTSRRPLTWIESDNNRIRTTAMAFAAAVGTADAIRVVAHDEVSGGTEEGRRLAHNVQHLLREEGRLHEVSDPARGSYHIEALTRSLAEAAWDVLREIEAAGGCGVALRSGWINSRLVENAAHRTQALRMGRDILVGVNRFVTATATPIPPDPIGPSGRLAEPFETLRSRVAALSTAKRSLGLAVGPDHADAAAWVREALHSAGFVISSEDNLSGPVVTLGAAAPAGAGPTVLLDPNSLPRDFETVVDAVLRGLEGV